MPSIIDLALCANAVYDANAVSVGPWRRAVRPFGDDSWGFFASAYLHQNNQELVIAYRGTDDLSDAATDVTIFLGKYPNQAVHAEQILTKWLNQFNRVKKVYLTGHSLGGGLASLMADAHNLPAVTFNAPGMARSSIPDWVPIGVKDIVAWGKALFSSEDDILHIRANYDFVSIGTGPRMGIVHNIPASCQTAMSSNTALTIALQGYGAVKLLVDAGKFVLCQHQMVSILLSMQGNPLYSDPLNFSKFK